MRVTSKGQVTIPKPVRDRLGLKVGSEVSFIEADDGIRLVRRDGASSSGRDADEFERWLESVRGTIDTNGMDGVSYTNWLRGDRDDDPR